MSERKAKVAASDKKEPLTVLTNQHRSPWSYFLTALNEHMGHRAAWLLLMLGTKRPED